MRSKNEIPRTYNFICAHNLHTSEICVHCLNTGTQLLVAIIDALSIANAYCYGVSYARPSLLRMRRSTTRALEITFNTWVVKK